MAQEYIWTGIRKKQQTRRYVDTDYPTWRTKGKNNFLKGDSINLTNICIMGKLEGEEREKGTEKFVWEIIIGKNLSTLMKNINLYIQEVQ